MNQEKYDDECNYKKDAGITDAWSSCVIIEKRVIK